MCKRVLEGGDPSGIYKVTNVKTNEIYIGKSTTVASRWTNHVKSAFGLEGVADSQF
jgi:excinuclease UvrABC nuclease subunit